MAEAIATIPFVSAVSGLIDVSTRFVSRVNDFKSQLHDVPEAFKHISAKLRLILEGLRESEEHAQASGIDDQTRAALIPTLIGCKDRIASLDAILKKILPNAGDRSVNRIFKAAQSLRKDKEVQKMVREIDGYLATLTFHNTVPKSGSALPKLSSPLVDMIPTARDSAFVDRPSVLAGINACLAEHRRAALAGIGGAVKTQIAIEKCYRTLQDQNQTHIFWMHATSISNLVRSCTEIVERLQLADSNDPKIDILRLLQRWLDEQRNGNWLLVVDNIDDLSILEEKLPSQSGPKTMLQLLTYRAHGSILLTTRDRRVGERLGIRGRTIAVTFMSLTEGRELLNSRLPATVEGGIEATDRLVEELGGLPLAIAQAAAYMMENYMTVEDYLDILYEGGEEMQALLDESLSDDRRVDHDSNAVIRTWKLSFDQITREEIKAANMLSLMAMFDRQEVPEELLRGEDSRHGFINTIAVLQNFSLIVQSPERNTWSMHRLVQVCAQEKVAEYYVQREQSQLAMSYAEEALSIFVRFRGSQDIDSLRREMIVADCLNKGGRLKDAAKILEEVICIMETVHECEVELSRALGLLASTKKLGREYSVASSLLKRALDLLVQAVEPMHPLILSLKDSIALNIANHPHHESSDLAEAEALARQALTGRERVFGLYHPQTLGSQRSLARIIMISESYQESEIWFRRAEAGYQQVCGPEDIRTLFALHDLSISLNHQGKHEEAVSILRDVLASMARNLGPDDVGNFRVRNDLIYSLNKCGDYEEAVLHAEYIVSRKDLLATVEMPDVSNILSYAERTIEDAEQRELRSCVNEQLGASSQFDNHDGAQ